MAFLQARSDLLSSPVLLVQSSLDSVADWKHVAKPFGSLVLQAQSKSVVADISKSLELSEYLPGLVQLTFRT